VKREIVISAKATQSLQRIVSRVAEVSLIGAEDTRLNVLSALRKLTLNAENRSRKAKFDTLTGNYRSILAGQCRVYFKVEEGKILVLDIILEKPTDPEKST